MSDNPSTALAGALTRLCPTIVYDGMNPTTFCALSSPLYTITSQATHLFSFTATLPPNWPPRENMNIHLCQWVRLANAEEMKFYFTIDVERDGNTLIATKAAGKTSSTLFMPSPSSTQHMVVMRHTELAYYSRAGDVITLKLWGHPTSTTSLSEAGADETPWGTFTGSL